MKRTSGSETTEEAQLVALVENRKKEVMHLRNLIAHYQSQLLQAEATLHDAKSKLDTLLFEEHTSSVVSPKPKSTASLASNNPPPPDNNSVTTVHLPTSGRSRPRVHDIIKHTFAASPVVKVKEEVTNDVGVNASSSGTKRKFDHQTVASTSNVSGVLVPIVGTNSRPQTILNNTDHVHSEKSTARKNTISKGLKPHTEPKEPDQLIELMHHCSAPQPLHFCESVYVNSEHKRKLRSLVVCPMDDSLFATSALDGMVKLWEIKGSGATASIISSIDFSTPNQRSWPMDITWHPKTRSVFSVYNVAADDFQVSVFNASSTEQKAQVTFLNAKPHIKGTINSIKFMPWDTNCFVTGGSDHAVVVWTEEENGSWTSKVIHGMLHSSSVMGVAGLMEKHIVMSAGSDKRVIGYNIVSDQTEFTKHLDSKCLDVIPNPRDPNLYMVQTGSHGKQLRLYDVRSEQTVIQPFGWIQASSQSQSSLIKQCWSPDGFYITSGSADPEMYIFDIRYNSISPSQAIKAHRKRVFKAEWHPTLPLLISISSDLQIGMHKQI